MSCFFFFKQKTAYEMRISDWSSDVCSSDLVDRLRGIGKIEPARLAFVLLGPFVGLLAKQQREQRDVHILRGAVATALGVAILAERGGARNARHAGLFERLVRGDRKSTRLNSSH